MNKHQTTFVLAWFLIEENDKDMGWKTYYSQMITETWNTLPQSTKQKACHKP